MIEASARDSWEVLGARLRPFVAARVAPPDVDDVLQDVFLRMHRGLGGLRDDQRFGPWVYRVTRSAIIDHRRSRARAPIAGEVDEQDLPGDEPEDDGQAERDVAGALAFFAAQLPSPYREAITLVEIEGVSQVEAARMLGVSVSGMKSRVQRGRAKLRALLDACCEIALDARGRVVSCEPRPVGPRTPSCRCDD